MDSAHGKCKAWRTAVCGMISSAQQGKIIAMLWDKRVPLQCQGPTCSPQSPSPLPVPAATTP
ncbi:uncharacterized protein BO66DRAFT_390459 [Aspergillus aculeatinus CBS 121060]|uniref:Uncharacterized protein n=1 Tax=Aspergillus aculeatinus CBS 121060 TaxID=1448322 RepID=A0ACD1HDX2_9EURO|nr:hypothetical protein BO66DRAFT_390459 [Aspergillus aculeatinus CBS 121060]RAH71976.1 hypothetical protein BO66DRAFT_390459 [Aspergillus aculeatinus CBS 121060]